MGVDKQLLYHYENKSNSRNSYSALSITDKSNIVSDPNYGNMVTTRRLSSSHPPSKDYNVFDRTFVKLHAMMAKQMSQATKDSIIKEITETMPHRELETEEARLKKNRKLLDIKKVAKVPMKKDLTAKFVFRQNQAADVELLEAEQSRLLEHYEMIKRILHDKDAFLYNLYYSKKSAKEDSVVAQTSALALVEGKQSKAAFKRSSALYKRAYIEETGSDTSFTNDLYDYTKGPRTERHVLDEQRKRASRKGRCDWDAVLYANVLRSRFYGSLVPGSSTFPGAPPLRSASLHHNVTLKDQGKEAAAAPAVEGKEKGKEEFAGVSETMEGISRETRKTIAFMTKYGQKKDAKQGAKSVDAYIWYTLDPIAKRKYDTFLQKYPDSHFSIKGKDSDTDQK